MWPRLRVLLAPRGCVELCKTHMKFLKHKPGITNTNICFKTNKVFVSPMGYTRGVKYKCRLLKNAGGKYVVFCNEQRSVGCDLRSVWQAF